MAVTPEKTEALKKRMLSLGLKEEDLLEKFIQGGGRGGQKMNKTSSCVYIKHLPTEIEVKCQKDRSREINRFLARRELCDKLEEKLHGKQSKKQLEIEKIRKQKQRRKRRADPADFSPTPLTE